MTAPRLSPSGSVAASSPDGWRAHRTALTVVGLVLLVGSVAVVLLVTASRGSALGRARAQLGDAAASTRAAITVGEVTAAPSPSSTPSSVLDPASAAAIARSRDAVPVAAALIASGNEKLDDGDTVGALADFNRLVTTLAVIQPRDGRVELDVAAGALRSRLTGAVVPLPAPTG
jgi:hypothetical protein